jgi:hypothetical protein
MPGTKLLELGGCAFDPLGARATPTLLAPGAFDTHRRGTLLPRMRQHNCLGEIRQNLYLRRPIGPLPVPLDFEACENWIGGIAAGSQTQHLSYKDRLGLFSSSLAEPKMQLQGAAKDGRPSKATVRNPRIGRLICSSSRCPHNTGLSGKAPSVRLRGTLSAPIRCSAGRWHSGSVDAGATPVRQSLVEH